MKKRWLGTTLRRATISLKKAYVALNSANPNIHVASRKARVATEELHDIVTYPGEKYPRSVDMAYQVAADIYHDLRQPWPGDTSNAFAREAKRKVAKAINWIAIARTEVRHRQKISDLLEVRALKRSPLLCRHYWDGPDDRSNC